MGPIIAARTTSSITTREPMATLFALSLLQASFQYPTDGRMTSAVAFSLSDAGRKSFSSKTSSSKTSSSKTFSSKFPRLKFPI